MSDKTDLPSGKHTLIEEGTVFKGSLSSNCPIVVVGKIEGDVTGPMIHVSTTGVVAGKVRVKELRSHGELAGDVEAEAVQIAGVVRDKTVIRARTLQVTLNTSKGMEVTFGDCELAIGDEPNKEAAVSAALATEGAAEATPNEIEQAKSSEDKGARSSPEDSGTKPDEDRSKRRQEGTQPPPIS
jgi:cytoskeletal protein CcmA (bactofilin family)